VGQPANSHRCRKPSTITSFQGTFTASREPNQAPVGVPVRQARNGCSLTSFRNLLVLFFPVVGDKKRQFEHTQERKPCRRGTRLFWLKNGHSRRLYNCVSHAQSLLHQWLRPFLVLNGPETAESQHVAVALKARLSHSRQRLSTSNGLSTQGPRTCIR
jgi:hypothetical protein